MSRQLPQVQLKRVVDVAIVNMSTVMGDDQARQLTEALRIQVHEHFAPIWGIDATLWFVGAEALKKGYSVDKELPLAWVIFLMDDSDVANALGYHDITPKGMPVGKCFLKTDQEANSLASVTVSHELLEMLADPWIQDCVFAQTSDSAGTIVAKEVCDACEDDQFAYPITLTGGAVVKVSDFVTPAYFMAQSPIVGATLDYTGQVKNPLTLLPGGYLSTFDATGKGWTQITAELKPGVPGRTKKGESSRFARRKRYFTPQTFGSFAKIETPVTESHSEADNPGASD